MSGKKIETDNLSRHWEYAEQDRERLRKTVLFESLPNQKNNSIPFGMLLFFGGDDETRTHYLYNANVALSQMSYAPKCL